MEFCTYAVTGILSHDAVASVLAIALHRVAYITESAASDSRFDALIQALFCGVAQPLRFVGNLSGSESSGIIAVVAVNFGAEVNADYVALTDNTLFARNTVNDLIIYGNACGGRESVQMQEIRLSAMFLYILIRDVVNLPGSNARFNRLACHF